MSEKLNEIAKGSFLRVNEEGKAYWGQSEGGGGSGGAQPDWNQNDNTAADYVKNRPFWREKTKELLVPGITGPIDVTTEDNGRGFFIATGELFGVAPDATNYVVFDGVEYTCEPYYSEEARAICIGSFDFRDYPFFIVGNMISTKTAGTHTVLQYYDLDTIQTDYAPHLVVRTLNTADRTPYLAMEDVEKIDAAFENGVPIRLYTNYGNLSVTLRVDNVESGLIHASGLIGTPGTNITQQIVFVFSAVNGSLYRSYVSHLGSIKEDDGYYPLMYIGNRSYKITVGDNGALTATQVT